MEENWSEYSYGFAAKRNQPEIEEGPDLSKMIRIQVTDRTAFFVPKGTDLMVARVKWENAHINSAY
jgi:hypothetical protein